MRLHTPQGRNIEYNHFVALADKLLGLPPGSASDPGVLDDPLWCTKDKTQLTPEVRPPSHPTHST